MSHLVTQKTPDPVLIAILTGQTVWAQLTRVQQRLLAQHRTVVDETASKRTERYAVLADPVVANPRTLESLRRKGVVDDSNRLTWTGFYAVIWGPDQVEATREMGSENE